MNAKPGAAFTVRTPLHLKTGFHVNSNTPNDEYLIPLRLTWSPGPAQMQQIVYPKPQLEKFAFSEKPVSVYSGTFAIETRFNIPAKAPAGTVTVSGKLRYQACSNKECLPPKTIDIQVPVDIQ